MTKFLPLLIADIDGSFAYPVNVRALMNPHSHPFFPQAIAHLNEFCAETGAKVSLIGARLRITSEKKLEDAFRNAGFEGDFDRHVLRSWLPFQRSHDLDKFLHEKGLMTPQGAISDTVVIVDDRAKAYSAQQLRRLVMPDTYIGFTEANRYQALQTLGHTTSPFGWENYSPIKSPKCGGTLHSVEAPGSRPLGYEACVRNSIAGWRDRVTPDAPSAGKSR